MSLKTFRLLLAVGAASAFAAAASGAVINFDDLVGQGPVPNGYGGVADWSGWEYYDWSQPPYNPHSPPTRVYNYSDLTFGFGTDVVFEGAWFAGYDSVYFTLYNNGGLVHTSASVGLDGDGVPKWLASGYGGLVDEVKVNGTPGFFVMDDVQYIPAPGSLALLGISGLALRRRR